MSLSLSFPDQTYSSSNKPSDVTLKADLTAIETDVNTHEADETAHGLDATLADWVAWSPTLSGMTVGNGTVVAKYNKAGKKVTAKLFFEVGSTTSFGTYFGFTLPATASDLVGLGNLEVLGTAALFDGTVARVATVYLNSTTVALIRAHSVSGSYVLASSSITSTVPFTWAAGDIITCEITYQAA